MGVTKLADGPSPEEVLKNRGINVGKALIQVFCPLSFGGMRQERIKRILYSHVLAERGNKLSVATNFREDILLWGSRQEAKNWRSYCSGGSR
jgi:hypothetical protein